MKNNFCSANCNWTLSAAGPMLADALVGVLAGAAVLVGVSLVRRLWRGRPRLA